MDILRNRIDIPEGLYGITGDNFANGKSNYQCVEEMIKGGKKKVIYGKMIFQSSYFKYCMESLR